MTSPRLLPQQLEPPDAISASSLTKDERRRFIARKPTDAVATKAPFERTCVDECQLAAQATAGGPMDVHHRVPARAGGAM